MRRMMICASVMLALLQLWPVVFGRHEATAALATSHGPGMIAAVAMAPPAPVKPAASLVQGPPKSCYQHYRAAFQVCAKGDRTCRLHAADTWDLCEATGNWPEQ